jgi:hypothetical protein
MQLKSFLSTLLLIAAPLSATDAQAAPVTDRGTIRVITDVLIPTGMATAPRATLPQANDQVLGCPAGYQRSNYSGQFAICLGTVCKGRKPLCVKYETIHPDDLLASRPSQSGKTVVWRVRPSLAACGDNSILAGQMPNCSAGSCPAQGAWNVCADTRRLDYSSGGGYLSDLKVTEHGLHHHTPACPAGLGVSAGFADGGGGYLYGNQRICQGSSIFEGRPLPTPPPPSVPGISFTLQPTDQNVENGRAYFTVMATTNRRGATINYQWQECPYGNQTRGCRDIPGETNYFLYLTSTLITDRFFRAKVSATNTTPPLVAYSRTARLRRAFAITEQPADQVSDGGPVMFSVGAISKVGPLDYQWYQKVYRTEQTSTAGEWIQIPGATQSTLLVNSTPQDANDRAGSGTKYEYYVVVSVPGVSRERSTVATLSWVPAGSLPPAEIECGMLPQSVSPNLRGGKVHVSVPFGCSFNRELPLTATWKICLLDTAESECRGVPANIGGSLTAENFLGHFLSSGRTATDLFNLLQQGKFYIDLTVSAPGVDDLRPPRIAVLPPAATQPPPTSPPVLGRHGFWSRYTCFNDTSYVPTEFRVFASINRAYQPDLVTFSWETRASRGASWEPLSVLANLQAPAVGYQDGSRDGDGEVSTHYFATLSFPFEEMSSQVEQAQALWGPREYRVIISSALPGVPSQIFGPISITPRACGGGGGDVFG